MQNLIRFIQKTLYIFLFLVLGGLSVYFIYQGSSYKQWAINMVSKEVFYPVYWVKGKIKDIAQLSSSNKEILNQNRRLLERVSGTSFAQMDSTEMPADSTYLFILGKVLETSINKQNNLMIINRGTKDGVAPDMGVISPSGIVGVVKDVSEHFSIVLPIINTQFSVAATIADKEKVGVINWDGSNFQFAQINNLANIDDVAIGDTIYTQYSLLFPPHFPIGIVEGGLYNKPIGGYYHLQVRLLANFNKINYVFIIKNSYQEELQELTERSSDE